MCTGVCVPLNILEMPLAACLLCPKCKDKPTITFNAHQRVPYIRTACRANVK